MSGRPLVVATEVASRWKCKYSQWQTQRMLMQNMHTCTKISWVIWLGLEPAYPPCRFSVAHGCKPGNVASYWQRASCTPPGPDWHRAVGWITTRSPGGFVHLNMASVHERSKLVGGLMNSTKYLFILWKPNFWGGWDCYEDCQRMRRSILFNTTAAIMLHARSTFPDSNC